MTCQHGRRSGVYATGYGSGANAEEAEGFGLQGCGSGGDIGRHGPLRGGPDAVAGQGGEVGDEGLEAVDRQAPGVRSRPWFANSYPLHLWDEEHALGRRVVGWTSPARSGWLVTRCALMITDMSVKCWEATRYCFCDTRPRWKETHRACPGALTGVGTS